jgi:hypothetical protein
LHCFPNVNAKESIFDFFLSGLDFIQDEQPYWNRQQGRDHIFTFTHDYGACFTYVAEDTMKPERLQVNRYLPFQSCTLSRAVLIIHRGGVARLAFGAFAFLIVFPALKASEMAHSLARFNDWLVHTLHIQTSSGATSIAQCNLTAVSW